MAADKMSVNCCIAGGGPAGIMLGLLLARAGVDILVLEKHADFLRDFRGDTIHPSTREIMHELGLLEDLLKLPHQKASRRPPPRAEGRSHERSGNPDGAYRCRLTASLILLYNPAHD